MHNGTIEFFVPGVPVPGGSKKAFRHARTGKVIVTDDAKGNKAWRDRVAAFASTAMGGKGLLQGPLVVSFTFVVPRPKGHFGTGRNAGRVRAGAPSHPTVKPDVLKLARAAEDAMTGVVYRDDAQTVELSATKTYGDTPGVSVAVMTLAAGDVTQTEKGEAA